MKRKCICLALLAALVLCLFGCKPPQHTQNPDDLGDFEEGSAYTLYFNKAECRFENIGDLFALTVYANPAVKDLEPQFSSANPSIANVDGGGCIQAVANGITAITAKAIIDGRQYTASCIVSVEDATVAEKVPEEEVGLYDDPGPAVPPVPEPQLDDEGFLCSDNLHEYNIYNRDAVAWLYVPNTTINIPVAQSSAEDPEYYLKHGFNYYPKYSGCAFLDYRSSVRSKGYISNQQTVIYGHARGTDVFDELERTMIMDSWYKNGEKKYIYLNTQLEDYVWEIFACYYADLSDDTVLTDLTTLDYSLTIERAKEIYSEAEIENAVKLGTLPKFLQDRTTLYKNMVGWRTRMVGGDSRYAPFRKLLGMRIYDENVIQMGDRVLTLMTCADTGTPIRFVVQARLISIREK